jgi:hypothetical protein
MEVIDKVIELDLGCVPEAAVSGAVLVETEHSTFLTFNAQRPITESSEAVGHAVVEFPMCSVTLFGYPNDEALPGHPLYSSGLGYYGIFEVLNPSWVKRIQQQNSVSFPKREGDRSTLRHFIITFHDSTFECLADDIHLTISNEPYKQIFDRITQRIMSE